MQLTGPCTGVSRPLGMQSVAPPPPELVSASDCLAYAPNPSCTTAARPPDLPSLCSSPTSGSIVGTRLTGSQE